MAETYRGVIVLESLVNPDTVLGMNVLGKEFAAEENWHLYRVEVTEQDVDHLSGQIRPGWYMHFWRGREMVVVFKGKTFRFNYDDRTSWEPAVAYGLAQGIPKEQLDFPIEF